MSRRAPRYRIDLAATAVPLLGGDMAVCRTRDVSAVGLCLDTAAWFPLGTRLSVALVDPASGSALEVIGDVVREATQRSGWQLGIAVIAPPPEWQALVAGAARTGAPPPQPARRLRVLVVGDGHRQRSAMALYVTSGWDVLFATDEDSVAEAIGAIELDAVVAELDAADPRLDAIMRGVRDGQPTARRIARGRASRTEHADHTLVHRFVDRDAGLEALLDAVTAVSPDRT